MPKQSSILIPTLFYDRPDALDAGQLGARAKPVGCRMSIVSGVIPGR